MLSRVARLFTIRTKFEAFLLIYALALGAAERGEEYLIQYPGAFGWFLFACCAAAVLIAGVKILDGLAYSRIHR